MKNSKDWAKEIEEVYDGVKAERMKPQTAVVLLNAVSQIISLTRLELEHSRLLSQHGQKPKHIRILDTAEETTEREKTESRRDALLREAAELDKQLAKSKQ